MAKFWLFYLPNFVVERGVLALRLLPKKPFAPLISRFKSDLVSCHAIIFRLGGCRASEFGRDR